MNESSMPAKWTDLFEEMFADVHEENPTHRWELARVDQEPTGATGSFIGPIEVRIKDDKSVCLWYRLARKMAVRRLGKVLISFRREIQVPADWPLEDVERVLFAVYDEIGFRLYNRLRYEDPRRLEQAEEAAEEEPTSWANRMENSPEHESTTKSAEIQLPVNWVNAFHKIFDKDNWSLLEAERDPVESNESLKISTRSGTVIAWHRRCEESPNRTALIRFVDSEAGSSERKHTERIPPGEWKGVDIRLVLQTLHWNVEGTDEILRKEQDEWTKKFNDVFNGHRSAEEPEWVLEVSFVNSHRRRRMTHYSFRHGVFFKCLEVKDHAWRSSYGCVSFWFDRSEREKRKRTIYMCTYGQKCSTCHKSKDRNPRGVYSPSAWEEEKKERVVQKLHSKIHRLNRPLSTGPVTGSALPANWTDLFREMFSHFENHPDETWTLRRADASPQNVPFDQSLELKTKSGDVSVWYQFGSPSTVWLRFSANSTAPEAWTGSDIEISLFTTYLMIRHSLCYETYDVEEDIFLVNMVLDNRTTRPHIPSLCEACKKRKCHYYLERKRNGTIGRLFGRGGA